MRRREWGIRMYHESLCHERNCFVTLTYSDENLPGDLKINRHDPQTFMKRLRHHSQTPIRYFLTGEYGDKTKRPHYHAILFGEDFLGGGEYISNGLYTNKLLEAIWQHGTVGISQFNMSTALYVSGYVAKKCGDKDTFSIMSRNPPLGQEWVRKHKDNIRRLGSIQIDGKSYPVPSTYMKWVEGVEEYQPIKEKIKSQTKTYTDLQLKAKGLNLKGRDQVRVSNSKI